MSFRQSPKINTANAVKSSIETSEEFDSQISALLKALIETCNYLSAKKQLTESEQQTLTVLRDGLNVQPRTTFFKEHYLSLKRQVKIFAEKYTNGITNKEFVDKNIAQLFEFGDKLYTSLVIEPKVKVEIDTQLTFCNAHLDKKLRGLSPKKLDGLFNASDIVERQASIITDEETSSPTLEEKSKAEKLLPPLKLFMERVNIISHPYVVDAPSYKDEKRLENYIHMEAYIQNLATLKSSLSSGDIQSCEKVFNELYRYAVRSSVKPIRDFAAVLLFDLSRVLGMSHEKKEDLIVIEIDDYVKQRELELSQDKHSLFYGIKTFFQGNFGSGDGEAKISAAQKLKLAIENEKLYRKHPTIQLDPVIFTPTELQALTKDRLGEIIARHKKAGALPKAFLDQEAVFLKQKAANDRVIAEVSMHRRNLG